MITKKLSDRPHQIDALNYILDNLSKTIPIHHATGQGKSLVGSAAGLVLASKGYGVIISTIMENSELSFASDCDVDCGEHGIVSTGDIRRLRGDGPTAPKLTEMLLNPKGVVITLHASLIRQIELLESDDFNGDKLVLIIDEYHHAGEETNLGRLLAVAQGKGVMLVLLSATPHRADGQEFPLLNLVEPHEYTLSQAMADGHAPGMIVSSVIPVEYGAVVPDGVASGSCGDWKGAVHKTVIVEMVEQWAMEEQPKLLVRIPAMTCGTTEFAEALRRAFKRCGARAVNACGENGQLSDLLDKERSRTYEDSEIDVIIGCVRVAEAMDWPHCTSVFCLGVPQSLVLIEQMIGRCMRKKDATCPKELREQSAITFFLPCASLARIPSFADSHSWHMLLVCSLLEHINSSAACFKLNTEINTSSRGVKYREAQTGQSRTALWKVGRSLNALARALETELGRIPTNLEVQNAATTGALDMDFDLVAEWLNTRAKGKYDDDESYYQNDISSLERATLKGLAADFGRAAARGDSTILELQHTVIREYAAKLHKLNGAIFPGASVGHVLSASMWASRH